MVVDDEPDVAVSDARLVDVVATVDTEDDAPGSGVDVLDNAVVDGVAEGEVDEVVADVLDDAVVDVTARDVVDDDVVVASFGFGPSKAYTPSNCHCFPPKDPPPQTLRVQTIRLPVLPTSK